MPLSLHISLVLFLCGNQNSKIADFIMQSMPMPSVNRQRKSAALLDIHCNSYFLLPCCLVMGILQTIFNVRDEI